MELQRQAARDSRVTQSSSVAGSAAMPGDVGEDRGVVGRHAVDDGQARVDGGAVAGIDAAIDRGREHDAAALLQSDEGVAPGWIVGREAGAGDGDQAAALGETRQRRGDVAQRCVGDAAIDMCGDREGRVHQHDGRTHGRVEMIVDMGRVVSRDGDAGKQAAEQIGTRCRRAR